MPITASVVLVTFTWLLIFPTALAAQTQTPHPPQAPASSSSDETELMETLAKIEAKLAMLHAKLAKAEASHLEREELQRLRARLEILDTRVRKAFDQMSQHLKDTGMPTEMLQRHQAMVATYDTELATLRQHLDTLAAATNDDTRKDTAAQALQYLRKKQPRRTKPRFDPEKFPFRVPDGKVRPPKATQKEFDSSLWDLQPTLTATAELLPGLIAEVQAAPLPALSTPEDLAPTEDVQITDEIKTLAAALENNPVKIYNWVHDTIEFLPTYGSIQGAHLTLQTKRGNAFDTASLLIALLRAANIHARYVYGTVQIPITQVMNWVGGVTVPEAALQILGQGGIPNTGLVQGGAITAVKLEHVWVEAWVDFQPSRGAVHRQGDTWVPLDAAFKRYQVTPGIDIQAQVLFDAQAFLAQATQGATVNAQEGWVKSLHQANINAFLLDYQEQVQLLVEEQKLHATLDDVLGARKIVTEARPVLAASLPYSILVTGTRYATLPAALRHHVTVAFYINELDRAVETPTVDYTISLPALNTQRLGVTYVPATDADRQLLASYQQQQAPVLPLYLLRVIPQLQLDGRTVVTGPADQMGRRHFWSVTLRDPQGQYTSTEHFTGSAGDELVFGVNGNGLTETVLQAHFARQPSETAAENLHTVGLVYWLLADLQNYIAAKLSRVTSQRLPSVGLFAAPLNVTALFGIPYRGFYRERRMDVARDLLAAAGNDATQVVAFRTQSGWQSSYLEGAVFDMLFGHPQGSSIAAVQLLQEANAQGIPLYTLTAQTLPGALAQLQLDPEVLQDISAAVNTGKTVLVSAREVTRATWSGVGYIIQDQETGAGVYLIQGGFNGGIEGGCKEQQLEPVSEPIVALVFSIVLFIVVVALIVALINALPILVPVLAGAGIMALIFDVSPAIAAGVPPSGDPGLWRVLFGSQYGPFRHTHPFPGAGIGKAPGICTDEQHKLLHKEVRRLCALPGNRDCITEAQQRNCAYAQQCAFNSFACINARVIIMFECFGGGNEAHWGEVGNRLRGLGKCVDCLVENGCTNPFVPF